MSFALLFFDPGGADPGWMQYLVAPRMEVEHAWLVQGTLWAITIAYFGIVTVLGQVFLYKRDRQLRIVMAILALLFGWRGLTQLLSIWTLYHPEYRSNLVLQTISAVLALAAIAALVWALPILHRMPTPGEMEALKRAGETHPYGYLIKPFLDRELHATIKMALVRSRADEAVRENEAMLFRALVTTPISEC